MKQRKLNRLKDFNYSQNGCYFVTICTKDRINYFGKIENGKMVLNDLGKIAYKYWEGTSKVHKNIILDNFVIMPNHFHGILGIFNDIVGDAYSKSNQSNLNRIVLNDNADSNQKIKNMRPLQTDKIKYDRSKMQLSKIIQLYKSSVTRKIKHLSTKPNHFILPLWQRSFYDHIIRTDKSLNNIREYIQYNPIKWEWDIENKLNKSHDRDYYIKLFAKGNIN